MALAAGDREDARRAYQQALDIAQQLADRDPGNAQWQRDLGIAHDRIGNVALAAGDREDARRAYQQALDIAQQLADRDPGNAEWQRDLGIAHSKIGDVALAAGDREDSRRAYQQALDIAQQLADRDPGNAQSQRDLAICFTKNSRCALPSSTDFLIRALIITEELEINNKLPIQNKIWIPELQWAIRNIGNVDINTIERRLSIVDHHTIDNLIYLSAAREMRKDLSRDLSPQTKNIIPEVITMMDDPTSRKIGEIADFLNIPAKSRAAFRRLILDFAAGAQSSMSRRQQWENRKGKELAFTPYDWIKKYYAREITLGALHKGIIRSDDRKLYDALFNWLRDPANQLPDGFLPTKAEWNDRRAIEAGAASNRAEVDPGIKAALSLYDVVRQQQRATRLSRPARPGVAQRFYRRGRSL